MIKRIVICIAALYAVSTPAWAQDANCVRYTVNTSLLNISQQAGGDIYKDALFDGDVVCVAQQQNVAGKVWAYISNKVEQGDNRTLVDGWAPLDYLAKASGSEAALPPPAAPAAPLAPAVVANPPPAAAPSSSVVSGPAPVARKTAGPPIRPEDILRFDQAIPFGPYPINGHSLAEMIESEPLFSPIEGLDESTWKKKCTNCHQWTKQNLCDQGATYVEAPKNVLRVPHPFGGTLKIALMRWAKSGCP
jgi:hypothetical protein